MNARQHLLLQELLNKQDHYQQASVLAKRLNCSERTVRSDLSVIDEMSEGALFFKVHRTPGKGIKVEVFDDEKKVRYLLQEKEMIAGVCVYDVCFEILTSHLPKAISELKSMDFLSVNEKKQILNKVKSWLLQHQIELKIKQGVGISLCTTSLNKRIFLVFMLKKEGEDHLIKKHMAPYEWAYVSKIMARFSETSQLYFTDESMETLVNLVLVSVKSIKNKDGLTLSFARFEKLKHKNIYHDIKTLTREIETYFKIKVSESEMLFLTANILAAKIKPNKTDEITKGMRHDEEATRIAKLLVTALTEKIGFDFSSETELFHLLIMHLETTVYRLKYDIPIINPLTKEIKTKYPFMFDLILEVIVLLESELKMTIKEEEIAYLTLHFQAALERRERTEKKAPIAAIVCHLGIGVSEILKVRLTSFFPELIIKATLKASQVDTFLNQEQIDFLITTCPLTCEKVPAIFVSPLLSKDDQAMIREFVEQSKKQHPKEAGSLIKYINPAFIYPQQTFTHRFEVIEFVGNRLYMAGIVKGDFTHQTLLREKKASTAIGSGISIPHGLSSEVLSSAISLVTLKSPIKWGDEWVRVVFLLAIKEEDQEAYRTLYQNISAMLDEPSKINCLTREFTQQGIIKCLSLPDIR